MSEPETPALAPPDMEGGTAAAKLRKHVPEIESLLQRGVRRAVILDLLEKRGVVVNENYLSVFLTRERRARERAERVKAPVQLPAVQPLAVTPPALDRSPAASAAIQTSDEQFAAALDPRKRAAFADKYVNTKPPLFAAKPKGENQ